MSSGGLLAGGGLVAAGGGLVAAGGGLVTAVVISVAGGMRRPSIM